MDLKPESHLSRRQEIYLGATIELVSAVVLVVALVVDSGLETAQLKWTAAVATFGVLTGLFLLRWGLGHALVLVAVIALLVAYRLIA